MSQISFYNQMGPTNSKEVFDFLVHNQSTIMLKIKTRHYKTKVISSKGEFEFLVYRFNQINYQNEDVICAFEIKDEKYFFVSKLNSNDREVRLKTPLDIHHLQRRNDFRVAIPSNVSYECIITSVNFRRTNYKAELRDLSLGGCLVSLNNANQIEMEKDFEVEFSLKVQGFENTAIITLAKHIRPVESNNTLQLGLQYVDPSQEFLRELQSLLVQLDRIRRGKNLE